MKKISLSFVAYFIPALPLLVYYRVPFTSFTLTTCLDVILAIYVLFVLLKKNKIKLDKLFFKYMNLSVWTIVITLIRVCFSEYTVHIGMSEIDIICIVIIFLGVFSECFDFQRIIKGYMLIAKINILVSCFQFIFYLVTSYRISLLIPFLPIADESLGILPFGTITYMDSMSLPGLFSERSHSAVFLIPYLCILMGQYSKKKYRSLFLRMIFVSVIIVASGSGNGVLSCALTWLFFGVLTAMNKKQYWIFCVAILLLIGGYLILIRIPMFNEMFSILFHNPDPYSRSKADLRVYRGFEAYFDLPFEKKIFGIGYRAFVPYAMHYNYHTSFDRGEFLEYMNCIAQILVYSGVVGLLFFIIFTWCLYKRSTFAGKIILVSFCAIAISSSVYYDVTWIFYITLIISLYKKENEEKYLYEKRRSSDQFRGSQRNRI